MENADLIKDFVEEAVRHIDIIETGLIKIEAGSGDPDTIHDIFRAVHSIKGTAGFFALKNIIRLSHAMENLLEQIRSGRMSIDNRLIDVLLSANDSLKSMVENVEGSEAVDISAHLEQISGFLGDGPPPARGGGSAGEQLPAPGAGRQEENNTDVDDVDKVDKPAGPNDLRAAISEAADRGCYAFKIVAPVSGQAGADSYTPTELIKRAESIGQVIGPATETGPAGTGDIPGGKSSFYFYITSVLEKSLVAIALEIPEDSISEADPGGLEDPAPVQGQAAHPGPEPDLAGPGAATPRAVPAVSPVAGEKGGRPAGQQHLVSEDSVRVHISLLNDLLNLASEMVLGRNQLLRVLESYRKGVPGLNAVLQNIDGVTSELQEKIMQTRMQPVSRVFNKFPRFIRELSRKLGKDVDLIMEGTEVELDKSIIEALGDPLTHLVRNAVDHGLETPEKRLKEGKPGTGTVILKAYHEGGHVNIDIIDDGAGIDVGNIKKIALQNGIISPAEAAIMGEGELLGLLFRPGFSTAEKVTDLSGRGVGMDVVKTNIEKLGGIMEIMTTPGQGTDFRLILPLTLAIIPSLIVEVKGQKFALPQVNLQEMLRIKPGDFSRRIEMLGDSPVMRLRGNLIPVIHLADALGLEKAPLDSSRVLRTLVIKSGSKRFGLVVDIIHDDEEILVKHIPRYLSGCKCYSGVTILGDGRTAMILDPEGIAARAGLRFMESEKPAADTVSPVQSTDEQQSLLLFKCSGTETFSVDLSMVARVEKIQADRIEKVGNKEFILFRGEALRVIRPEDYLPVTSARNNCERLFVIIPKLVRHPIGILIEKVLDTTEVKIQFNREEIRARGLVGSAVLYGRLVLVVNIHELLELAAPEHYQGEESKSSAGGSRTVLLVEDTPFFIKTEKNYLESAGYRVLTAVNGSEALKLLQENHVDVVVSDIEMPVMDGFELIKKVRADKRLAGLPVVAVTSRADERSRKRGIKAGFDFYEIKLDKENFLEKVKLAMEKRGM